MIIRKAIYVCCPYTRLGETEYAVTVEVSCLDGESNPVVEYSVLGRSASKVDIEKIHFCPGCGKAIPTPKAIAIQEGLTR